jgi:flagellar basal body-associated protein FliL
LFRITVFMLSALLAVFLYAAPGAQGEMEKRQPVPDSFVRLPKFTIPIVQNRELKQFCSFVIILEAADEAAAGRIREMLPRIADIAFCDSYALFGIVWSDDLRIHLPQLKKRLKDRYNGIFKKELVKEVLIQSFSDLG